MIFIPNSYNAKQKENTLGMRSKFQAFFFYPRSIIYFDFDVLAQ